MRFLTKSNGIGKGFEFAGFDDILDAAAELKRNGDDFILCYEFEHADVGKGGVFHDVTHKVCEEYMKAYGDKAEMAFGELDVPKLVKLHCADQVAEIEGEAEAELLAMNWDYYSSLGVEVGR